MPSPGDITGVTRVLVHLAYPSAHLKTPPLFNARCRERAVDAVLVPWQVHPDNLGLVMDALRVSESVAGAIVTIPHKQAVAGLCDVLEGPAEHLSVANVVRKDAARGWIGRALDGMGFVKGLEGKGHDLSGKSALLLGAGGVGVSIADALATAGVGKLVVFNRTAERAQALVERLGRVHPGLDVAAGPADAAGFDLVVNATSLGMKPDDPLPIDMEAVAPGTVVAEVIMEPEETALLSRAATAGAVPHAGKHMLTGQIDAFIDFVVGGDRGPPARASASGRATKLQERGR